VRTLEHRSVDISRAGYANLTATGIKSRERVQLVSPAVSKRLSIRPGGDRLTFTASDPSCSSSSAASGLLTECKLARRLARAGEPSHE